MLLRNEIWGWPGGMRGGAGGIIGGFKYLHLSCAFWGASSGSTRPLPVYDRGGGSLRAFRRARLSAVGNPWGSLGLF